MAGNADTTKSPGTVARTIAILRILATSGGETSISDIADELDLPRTTVHRLLQLLREQDMAEWNPDTRRYSAGGEFHRLSSTLVSRRPINEAARPIMREVVDGCSESCMLGVLLPSRREMTIVEQVESPHPLRFHIPLNTPLPLEWGCSGRVILANMDEKEIDAVLDASKPAPATGKKLPGKKSFKAKLGQIKKEGFDSTFGEKFPIPEVLGMAAPIFDGAGSVVGSLSLTTGCMSVLSVMRSYALPAKPRNRIATPRWMM